PGHQGRLGTPVLEPQCCVGPRAATRDGDGRAGVTAVDDRFVVLSHDVQTDVSHDHDLHRASSVAIRAARSALDSTSASLASRLAPPLAVWKCSSRTGVTSDPVTP